MAALKHKNHEKLAQAIASGLNNRQVAEVCGYLTKNGHQIVSRYAAKPNVAARINELRERDQQLATKAKAHTREVVIFEMLEVACNSPNHAAKVRALELLGVELGMFIKRSESRTVKNWADLSTKELGDIVEEAKREGLLEEIIVNNTAGEPQ